MADVETQTTPAAKIPKFVRPPLVSRKLKQYALKRDFGRTPEPAAQPPQRSAQDSRRRFVIQKHAAGHLHYDLRLEMHETLKSWAVPKSMPFQQGETCSAFHTEAHPLDYLSFEGVIPKGQYGGGTVMVWDIGTYEIIDNNYYKGQRTFFLAGCKCKGEWTLKRSQAPSNNKSLWLLTWAGR